MKDNEIKEALAIEQLPVVQAPELIKIKTISPKIVDQLPWIPINSIEWAAQEIIGRLPGGGIIVMRNKYNGRLSRVADLTYLETRAKELGTLMPWAKARDQANAELAALPQLFAL